MTAGYYYPGGYVSLQDGNHMKFNTMIADHLGHEFAHSQDRLNGTIDETEWLKGANGQTITQSEKYAVHVENKIRAEHGVCLRMSYNSDFASRLVQINRDSYISIYFTADEIRMNIIPKGKEHYEYKNTIY